MAISYTVLPKKERFTPPQMSMAMSPSIIADWIQPGAALAVVLGLAGFLWAEMQAMGAEVKTAIQASEAR